MGIQIVYFEIIISLFLVLSVVNKKKPVLVDEVEVSVHLSGQRMGSNKIPGLIEFLHLKTILVQDENMFFRFVNLDPVRICHFIRSLTRFQEFSYERALFCEDFDANVPVIKNINFPFGVKIGRED